jgi:hypothetical protein
MRLAPVARLSYDRRMRSHVRLLAFALLLVPAARAAGGDLTVRERIVSDGKTAESTTYYTADKNVSDGPRQRTVVDLTAKTVTMIDKESHSYAVATFDAMLQQGETMRQRVESAPPDVRQRMTGGDVSVTTKPTGKTEKIAGRDAKQYTIEAGPVSGEVWVAEDVKAPAGKEAWDKQSAKIRPFARPADRFADAIVALPGLPMRKVTTVTAGDRKSVTTIEVVEVSEKAPPPEALAVPEGFNLVKLPGL